MAERDHFALRLAAAVRAKGTPLCVGLDPRWELLPQEIMTRWRRLRGDSPWAVALAYEEFCRRVIDVVAPLVPVVKVQSAFFEQVGPPGVEVLYRVMQHARHQGLLVIFDGKRNDIGSTAQAYAAAYLGTAVSQANQSRERQRAQRDPQAPPSFALHGFPPSDAITVNPYLGLDSLQPFVDAAVQTGTGLFILVKTSNPGSADFQDLTLDGKPLYRHVADKVEQVSAQTLPTASTPPSPPYQGEAKESAPPDSPRSALRAPNSALPYGSVGAVVGATHPEQVAELRAAMHHAWLLLPGYGAQGAAATDVTAAFDADGLGALVNSSRAILFAHRREPYASRFGESRWQHAVEAATRDAIAELAAVG